jgi:hypothetical protein
MDCTVASPGVALSTDTERTRRIASVGAWVAAASRGIQEGTFQASQVLRLEGEAYWGVVGLKADEDLHREDRPEIVRRTRGRCSYASSLGCAACGRCSCRV